MKLKKGEAHVADTKTPRHPDTKSSKQIQRLEYKTVAFDYSLPGISPDIGESVAGPGSCCPACAAVEDDGLSDMELKSVRLKRDARFLELSIKHKAAKLQGMTHKVWQTVGGASVRQSHRTANNQKVLIDGKFKVGSEELFLPADPNASFAETANCRCDVKYVREDSSDNPPTTDIEQEETDRSQIRSVEPGSCEDLQNNWDELMDDIDDTYELLWQLSKDFEKKRKEILDEEMNLIGFNLAANVIGAISRVPKNWRDVAIITIDIGRAVSETFTDSQKILTPQNVEYYRALIDYTIKVESANKNLNSYNFAIQNILVKMRQVCGENYIPLRNHRHSESKS